MRYYLPCRHSRVDACYWHSRLFEQQTAEKNSARRQWLPQGPAMHRTVRLGFREMREEGPGHVEQGGKPRYTDKQKQELTKCTSAKFACLVKRNCPAGDVDCTKTKTC